MFGVTLSVGKPFLFCSVLEKDEAFNVVPFKRAVNDKLSVTEMDCARQAD